jgi:hypothetical protein
MLYSDFISYIKDGGEYRVEFENRTAWNAIARFGPDLSTQDNALLWLGKTRKQDRQFELASDREGHVVVTNKPQWGRLISCKQRQHVRTQNQLAALADLRERQRELDLAHAQRREAVGLARRLGLAWEAIAREVGLTKQAAWEQFRNVDAAP